MALDGRIQHVVKELASQGIWLCQYGNANGEASLVRAEEDATPIDGANVARAMDDIRSVFDPSGQWELGSYTGKHILESWRRRHRSGNPYISNGDFIVAMILSGYSYKFREDPESVVGPSNVNAAFKATCMKKIH